MVSKLSKLRVLVCVLLISVITVGCVYAAPAAKLQFYFAPQVMNDTTGEVVIDVNMRNFSAVVPENFGDLCSMAFSCKFDTKEFDVKLTETGVPEVIVDDATLVKKATDIEASLSDSVLKFTFIDSTLMNNLINEDGTLFRFTLVAKNVRKVWNSTETYSLRFMPGTIEAVLYNIDKYEINRFYDVEGVDNKVGAYNTKPSLITNPIGKHLTFTVGSSSFAIEDKTVSMDVPVVLKDERIMIPMRFFAESIGMSVEWDHDLMMASAYAKFKTLMISAVTGETFINSAPYVPDIIPYEENGRIYVSSDLVEALWPGAEISEKDGKLSIFIY